MSSSDTPVSRSRRQALRVAEERRIFLRFAFVWVAALVFLALAWY
jgi:hypothetical protein